MGADERRGSPAAASSSRHLHAHVAVAQCIRDVHVSVHSRPVCASVHSTCNDANIRGQAETVKTGSAEAFAAKTFKS
jgi:hypothetical protein